jgi:hypothetical protein
MSNELGMMDFRAEGRRGVYHVILCPKREILAARAVHLLKDCMGRHGSPILECGANRRFGFFLSHSQQFSEQAAGNVAVADCSGSKTKAATIAALQGGDARIFRGPLENDRRRV